MKWGRTSFAGVALAAIVSSSAGAEMLAIANYETLAEESLKALQLQGGGGPRREGIAVIELDRSSPDYGKILLDMPVDPETMLHHIFYNNDLTKAYVTSLAKPVLHVIDLSQSPWRLKAIPTPGCSTQENIIFSDDNKTWWVTCMGSANLVEGDAVKDEMIRLIDLPNSYPHGITLHEGIDRLLVTSCVAPDMSGAGHTIEVVEASTGKHLSSIQVAEKKGAAPVETVYVPGANPPVAYVTNMMENALWAMAWNPDTGTFDSQKVYDFDEVDALMPLEIYFNRAADRLYVTTADPGHFHIFDISDGPLAPKLLRQLPTAGGAHHVAFTPDESLAYVQNALLNIPGINDGSITVVDIVTMELVDSIETFKDQGLTPNSLTMLPEWYHPAGHFNNGPGRLQ